MISLHAELLIKLSCISGIPVIESYYCNFRNQKIEWNQIQVQFNPIWLSSTLTDEWNTTNNEIVLPVRRKGELQECCKGYEISLL